MGCDIHLMLEINKSGKWTAIKGIDQNYLNYALKNLKAYENFQDEDTQDRNTYEYFVKEVEISNTPTYYFLYNNRNYNLFSMLADVRNGIIVGEKYFELSALSSPRGIPADASKIYKKEVKRWGIDGHSHSYFTLNELDTSYWLELEHLYCFLFPDFYKQYLETGKIDYIITGRVDCNVISNEEMTDYICSKKYDPRNRDIATLISYDIAHYELAKDFYNNVILYLRELGNKYGRDNVRLVFFFDN